MRTAAEVHHAVEHVRSRHQNHAWADRDQAQGRTQLIAHRQRANNASKQCRAERLQQRVCAVLAPVCDAERHRPPRCRL